ncbi:MULTISPECIES: Kelch repeat-containing protein [Reichenbachiella]|uniref:Kelch repeat-containing protein n=1 Tax=Reichenbachiella TaxID=156993 RepID=UPI000E6BE708|nr:MULTISPECIES: kelch repeat-containing protein [Reichenbachiella]MBU2915184.1 galactose oxidase [Reichenbachiella agariperforans]RJE70336.1 galactose oxidase [Reichenbachiella sp. MSK19-1]
MKRKLEIGMLALLLGLIASCTTDTDDTVEDGNWVKRSSFDGVGRSGAVSFVIGDKAFVGLGFDGDDYLTDFWTYDAEKNFWQRVSDFPGLGRSGAVAFSIGDKGYVGTGYNDDEIEEELGDFWEYDSGTDTWAQVSDFAGPARYQAVGFAAGGYGYVGTGYDGGHLKDFWRYNAENDEWVQVVSLKGEKRRSAVSFVIDGYGYVCTGSNNGLYESDFWEFDPLSDDWAQLTDIDEDDDYDDILRESAVAFVQGGKGYITVGSLGSNVNTTWEYTPGSDVWEEKTAFEGSGRSGAVGFTINGRSYVALGQSGSYRYDDIWEFEPNETYDEDD